MSVDPKTLLASLTTLSRSEMPEGPKMTSTVPHPTSGGAPYATPRLVRYGAIEELTQGATHITTNIVDILSIQP